MKQKLFFLFSIQFLSYLWYFAVFLVIVPYLVINLGSALDFLLFTYFFKIRWPEFGLWVSFIEPLLNIVAAFFLVFGLGLILRANQILTQTGVSFPLSVISHKDLSPQKLTTSGFYAYIRHPMLLGYLLSLVGIAVFVRTFLGIFWVIPLLGAFSLEYLFFTEERHLWAWFGEEYQKYRAKTPALIPKWK